MYKFDLELELELEFVMSRDSCPIGVQIWHVLGILCRSLQWTDLWIKSIVYKQTRLLLYKATTLQSWSWSWNSSSSSSPGSPRFSIWRQIEFAFYSAAIANSWRVTAKQMVIPNYLPISHINVNDRILEILLKLSEGSSVQVSDLMLDGLSLN